MDDGLLRNRPFDELVIGKSASLVRTAERNDIELFAAVSGDVNPAHLDAAFAAQDRFGHVIVHGMWTGALISAVLGTRLPGPGTIYLDQTLEFRRPVAPGDTITATVTVRDKQPQKRIVVFDTRCTNQQGETVLRGTATVIAPASPIVWPRMARPEVAVRHHDRYEALLRAARAEPALRTAIVHPCSPDAIQAAVEVHDANLLEPVLIDPQAKIRAAAEVAQVSLAGIAIEAVEHSHAAAACAVEMGAAGHVGRC